MKTDVEQLRRRTQAEIADLRQLERLPLNSGRTETFGTATMPLLLVSGADPRHSDRCFVSVGAGGNVPPIAQNLPCGILAADGRLLGARRTDRNGSFWVRLSEPECRLRFVNEVRDVADVDILLELGDRAAYDQLEAALASTGLSATVRAHIEQAFEQERPGVAKPAILEIARVLAEFRQANAGPEDNQPIAAPALRRLDDAKYDGWRCGAVPNGDLAALTAADGPRPSGPGDWSGDGGVLVAEESRNEWSAIRGDRIRVRAPVELVPYGVVRIFAMVEDLLVGTCLLPLIKYKTVRSNSWPMARLVGERDLRTVRWYAQPATEETLPWFPADEVAALLNRTDVRDYEELQGQVERLLARVQQRELVRQREEEVDHG